MVFILFVCVSALILLLLYTNKKKCKNLPPGPYPWPVLGNVIEMAMIDIKYPHKALEKLSRKYGEIMSIQFGAHFMIIISSFEIMKEVLIKPEANLGRFVFPFVPDRAYGNPNSGIIWNSGESWQELKRYTIRTLRDFGFGKKNSMNSVMQEEVGELMSTIKGRVIDGQGEWEIDPHLLASSAINVLWSLVAGYRFSLDDKNLQEAVKLNDDILFACGLSNRYTAFPWVKSLLPKLSKHEEHLKCYAEMQKFLRRVIKDIQENRSARINQDAESYIEAFLDEIENRRGTGDISFTDDQLLVVLADLFLAGSETTSTSVNWMMYHLALNDRVQEKVYDEICRVVGSDATPTLDHEKSLIYMKATIYEMFRMSDIVPTPPPRILTDSITVRGYTLPKGAGIMYNMDPVVNDKVHWGDPDVFRPERFISTNADGTMQLVNTERVASFGFGKRLCLGETLAWNTLFLYVTNIFQTFKLSTIPNKLPPRDPVNSATLSPDRYSLHFELRK